jgi:DNA-binding HxlR family transcriptional regulator
MQEFQGKKKRVSDTPFGYTLSLIGGKWKMSILYLLIGNSPLRYNELQRQTGNISYKSLSVQLKELEADGLISRTEYPQIPPKVEYSITEKGMSLVHIMDEMCYWGQKYNKECQTYKGDAKPYYRFHKIRRITMSKNIVIVVGSPRHQGNTELLAETFAMGARESGNKVTIFKLSETKAITQYFKKVNPEITGDFIFTEVVTIVNN